MQSILINVFYAEDIIYLRGEKGAHNEVKVWYGLMCKMITWSHGIA